MITSSEPFKIADIGAFKKIILDTNFNTEIPDVRQP